MPKIDYFCSSCEQTKEYNVLFNDKEPTICLNCKVDGNLSRIWNRKSEATTYKKKNKDKKIREAIDYSKEKLNNSKKTLKLGEKENK
ncbi:hypothetical protein M0R19_04430 [Candidatus Pacearchaeota archaeon]|jgi:predicted Rdx family selenoprotein|nr:hypothetical protein [Candidatus Pacearchaeota archaeon]